MSHPPLLDDESVVTYLRSRKLLNPGPATAVSLGGGVSNVVIAVSQGARNVVVKQSLEKLRVDADWRAPVERIITEGRALSLVSRLAPGFGPEVLDIDEERFVVTMERAPTHWADWKSQLMTLRVDPRAAHEIGVRIGRIHHLTNGLDHLDADFMRGDAFELLRVDPYYRSSASRVPHLEERILELADDLVRVRECLVHGDLSPKNVLLGHRSSDIWLIDWEVAHAGDPVFDIAFMLTHLTLKSVHLPSATRFLDAAAVSFTAGYASTGPSTGLEWGRVLAHVGCLLIARFVGKSPAEYLTPEDRRAVLALGETVLNGGVSTLDQLHRQRDRICT